MTKNEFLIKFENLKKQFPTPMHIVSNIENCNSVDNLFRSANCYYVFNSSCMESCLYVSDGYQETRDVDCCFGLYSEDMCECTDYCDSNSCYFCQFVTRAYNLLYSYFCVDCHDCFGCTNLTNKSYCIFNVQYTKKEYEEKLPGLKKLSQNEVLDKLDDLKKKFPQLHSDYFNNINSEYCDYTYNSKNCYFCFDVAQDEDCGYLVASHQCKDVWDANFAVRVEQSAEISDSGDSYNCYEVTDSDRCYDCFFVDYSLDCHDCFGCVNLEHKKYCILNVQYTKNEYEKKLAEIKNEMGLKFSEPAHQA